MKRGLLVAAVSTALVWAAPAFARAPARAEVVVELRAPPLARAVAQSRALSASAKHARLDLASPTSAAYLASVDEAQRAVEARIRRAIPGARVRWRYQVVLNGLAVVLPRSAVGRLARIPGVARVSTGAVYRSHLDRSAPAIGAPALWGPTFSTVGQGIKIGIIDDGLDQRHPFFDPTGFAMPPGFPKGNTAFTTAKVVVARAFAPPRAGYRLASRPFDPEYSFHATHVAGIAAGDRGVQAGGRRLSGIAPGAYLGNYKVLTVPAASYNGLDGNSPEIAAAIEAAVRDGMDVINLSIGEPEVDPARDLAVRAIDAAADAGVVPAVSAGNSHDDLGRGSVWSPGSAAKAITAAAASVSGTIASFSSSGPTPVSLQLKPDVTAPGVGILSSVPRGWDAYSGTSMAAPHVAGAAALLRQRHPGWTVAQIKSALVLTGKPVTRGADEVPTTREGGGMIDLPQADDPRVFAAPSSLGFGLVRPGRTVARDVSLTDAGGGAGDWTVRIAPQGGGGDASVTAAASVSVPGQLRVQGLTGNRQGEETGFVVLTRGDVRRRIPYWLRVAAPALGRHSHRTLGRNGVYSGNTRGRPALVTAYRYPDDPSGANVNTVLAGPEQVFRVSVTARRRMANFGVRLVSRAPGVRVEPRIARAGDENRLAGDTVFPLVVNPYFASYYKPMMASAVDLPERVAYDVVFDSPTRAGAGKFRFRLWLNDTTPPSVRLLTPTVRRGRPLRLSVRDAGAGVWPDSLRATVDGRAVSLRYSRGQALVGTAGLRPGRHRVVFRCSDFQEAKNHENVYRILPNTRTFRKTFRVR